MSLPPPNIARQDQDDEASWQAQERALRGDPIQAIAAARLLRLASAIPAAGALGLMLAWGIGEVLSDRFWWSQFLEWIPMVLLVPFSGILLLAAEIARRLLRRTLPTERTLPRLKAVIVLDALMWGSIVIYSAQAELGASRALGFHPRAGANVSPARILFWNSGAVDRDNWTTNIISAKPDLCVFTSIIHEGRLHELAEAMTTDPAKAPTWTFKQDRFTVLSRARILRAGYTQLRISRGGGLDPREQGPKRYYDPGRAMFVELDPTLFAAAGGAALAADKPIVVWIIDLPSDLSIPKAVVTEQAAQAITAFDGPVLLPDELGRWVEQPPPTGHLRGFPKADIIVGDFNIPRGSRSLDGITGIHPPALRSAWHEAGYGYTATYPRIRSLWHLDQIFLQPHLQAVGFETLSAGSGTHRVVWSDVVLRSP